MSWCRGVLICSLAVGAVVAWAEPPFLNTFREHFKPSDNSAVGKANCGVCHQGPPTRNPFGKIVEATLEELHKTKVDDEVLGAVAKKQAPDGRTFGEVIASGTNPVTLFAGSTNNPPINTPPDPSPASAAEPAKDPLDAVVPKHSMHPAIVHFPIALMVFAAVLEVFGHRRKEPGLRQAATWALGGAAVGALGAVCTGLAALLRLQFGFEGRPLVHLSVALGAATLIFTTLFFKLRKQDSTPAYWVLLILGSALVMLAGHLGSLLVYG